MSCYNFLKKHPEATVISCLAHYINENDQKIGKTFSDIKSIDINKKYFDSNEPIGILHPGVMYYKDKFLEVGGYGEKFFQQKILIYGQGLMNMNIDIGLLFSKKYL